MTSMFLLYGCSTQPSLKNNTVISNSSNTIAIPKQVPSLNITLPFLADTSEKVSGRVPSGSEASLRMDGVHGGMTTGLNVQGNGYFSDEIVIPDNPVNSLMTLELLSNGKVLIKQSFKVGNPYNS